MHKVTRFLPAIILTAGVLLVRSAGQQASMPLDTPLKSIPLQLAGYSGRDYEVSEAERRVAGMSDYVFRVFPVDSAKYFSVYVAYYDSQTTGKTIHSPKNCMPGAGWEALGSTIQHVGYQGKDVPVSRWILANGAQQAIVYYWYQGRGRISADEYRVKWELLRDAARAGRTEEALVRIMVPIGAGRVGDPDWGARMARADSLVRLVAPELMSQVDTQLPKWGVPSPRT